jgi:hypothetical protein
MPQTLKIRQIAPPRPRARRTAAGVVAQYIHELSERHVDAARGRAVPVRKARASQAPAAC